MNNQNDFRNSPNLSNLATRARDLHGQVIEARKRGLSLAMDTGDVLIEAREWIEHGGWGKWLAGAGINERTARLYMQVARNRDDLETATVAGLREAAEWLAKQAMPAKLAKLIAASGDESACIDCEVPGGKVWLTFWRRGPDAYFMGWMDEWDDLDGRSWASAYWFKKPVTAKDGATIALSRNPNMKVVQSYGVGNKTAREGIEDLGAKLSRHSWGERLKDAA